MEKVIFKCYLNFIKEEDKKTWKKLKLLPVRFWVLYVITIILALTMFWISLEGGLSEIISLISIIVPFVLCGVLYYLIETFIIEIAEESLSEYLERCKNCKDWLEQNGIDTKEKMEILINRTKEEIGVLKQKKEKIAERITSVLQVLIIPIILLIISNYGKEEVNFVIGLARITTTLLVFLCIFTIVLIVINTINMFKISEIAKMEKFCLDLQGVLDLEVFEISEKKPSANLDKPSQTK